MREGGRAREKRVREQAVNIGRQRRGNKRERGRDTEGGGEIQREGKGEKEH